MINFYIIRKSWKAHKIESLLKAETLIYAHKSILDSIIIDIYIIDKSAWQYIIIYSKSTSFD